MALIALLFNVARPAFITGCQLVRDGHQFGYDPLRRIRVCLKRTMVIDGQIAHPVQVDILRPRKALLFRPVEEGIRPECVPVTVPALVVRKQVTCSPPLLVGQPHTRRALQQLSDIVQHGAN